MRHMHIANMLHIIIIAITRFIIFIALIHFDRLQCDINISNFLNKKAAAVGSGFYIYISFQNHAIGDAAEAFHIIHIILQILLIIISA